MLPGVQLIQYLYAKEQQSGYYTSKKRYVLKRLGLIDPRYEAWLAKLPPEERALPKRASALKRAKAMAFKHRNVSTLLAACSEGIALVCTTAPNA